MQNDIDYLKNLNNKRNQTPCSAFLLENLLLLELANKFGVYYHPFTFISSYKDVVHAIPLIHSFYYYILIRI